MAALWPGGMKLNALSPLRLGDAFPALAAAGMNMYTFDGLEEEEDDRDRGAAFG